MIELIALILLLGTCTFIYLHLMGWLWRYRELGNALIVQTRIADDLQKDRDEKIKGLRYEMEVLRKEIEAIQTDMNGINLKLGLKLK